MKFVLIRLIRLYQLAISPMFPSTCRHIPSCSQYAIEALNEHGFFYGSFLSIKRIGRCHPWGTHGYHPVPKKSSESYDGNK